MSCSKLFYVAISVLCTSCCSSLYYVNDPVIHANVREVGDLTFGAGVNTGSITSGLHMQATAAISDKIFAAASFSNYSGSCGSTSTFNGKTVNDSKEYTGHSTLLSGGYYKAIGNDFYFEGAAGAKFGRNMNVTTSEKFEFIHLKYFIQPGISYNRDHFQAGFALRMGVIDFLPHKTGSLHQDPGLSSMPYLDPGIYLGFGAKWVKLGIQLSTTIAENIPVAFHPLGTLLGLVETDPTSFSLFLRVTIPSGTIGVKKPDGP